MLDVQDYLLRILGTFKIKYDILDSQMDIPTNTEIVNVHIDLNTITKTLLKEDIEKIIDGNYKYCISSAILNMVAHFRAYFAYKFRLQTRFFLYYTNKGLKNDIDVFKVNKQEYHCTYENIKESLELVKIISKYCEGVYYIFTDKVDPVIACGYIADEYTNKQAYNICITKDIMWYQLIAMNKRVSILRPKRDETIGISKDNLYETLLSGSKYENKDISVKLLSAVYSYCGVPSRGIKGVKGIGINKAIKIFDKLIEDAYIINDYYPRIENLLDDTGINEQSTIIDNFYRIDLQYGIKNLTKSEILLITDSIVDKFSKNDLKMLNNTYYTGFNSLMLEELMLNPNNNKIKW